MNSGRDGSVDLHPAPNCSGRITRRSRSGTTASGPGRGHRHASEDRQCVGSVPFTVPRHATASGRCRASRRKSGGREEGNDRERDQPSDEARRDRRDAPYTPWTQSSEDCFQAQALDDRVDVVDAAAPGAAARGAPEPRSSARPDAASRRRHGTGRQDPLPSAESKRRPFPDKVHAALELRVSITTRMRSPSRSLPDRAAQPAPRGDVADAGAVDTPLKRARNQARPTCEGRNSARVSW